LLTRTIPTLGIFDPVMIFGTAVFGLFGMAIARASGERKLLKVFLLGASLPGVLTSLLAGIPAHGQSATQFAVSVTPSYDEDFPTPVPGISASVCIEFFDFSSNVVPFCAGDELKTISLGGTVIVQKPDAKPQVYVKASIAGRSRDILTQASSACVAATFAYESSWRAAFGVNTPPRAQIIIITSASAIGDCRYASVLIALSGLIERDRKVAGEIIKKIIEGSDDDVKSALEEQLSQFLKIDNYERLTQRGKGELINQVGEFLVSNRARVFRFREELSRIKVDAGRLGLPDQTRSRIEYILNSP
jgi:hypothetical protein